MPQTDLPRLLIVEDEQLLLEALDEEFRQEGFSTTVAKNGLEAIDFLKTEKFALIISDIRMPKSTGIDLLNYVRGQNLFHPPIILMSGFADISNSEAYALGADSIFPKPFDIEELVAAAKEFLIPPEENWAAPFVEEQATYHLKMEFNEQTSASRVGGISIGRGGAFIPMSSNFPTPHETVKFEFEVSGGETKHLLKGCGIVRWVRPHSSNPTLPPGMGLELKSLDAESISYIKKTLSTYPTASLIPLA